MRKTITFEQTYNYFDPGTKVRPTSSRCVLKPGIYTVISCSVPKFPGEDAICFVEGHKYGLTTAYLTEVETTE